jgi:hypothetical protein
LNHAIRCLIFDRAVRIFLPKDIDMENDDLNDQKDSEEIFAIDSEKDQEKQASSSAPYLTAMIVGCSVCAAICFASAVAAVGVLAMGQFAGLVLEQSLTGLIAVLALAAGGLFSATADREVKRIKADQLEQMDKVDAGAFRKGLTQTGELSHEEKDGMKLLIMRAPEDRMNAFYFNQSGEETLTEALNLEMTQEPRINMKSFKLAL